MKTWLTGLNDLIHDLSGAAWIGIAFALWMARGGLVGFLAADELTLLLKTWSWALTALFVLLTIQVGTGLIRLAYWKNGVPADSVKRQGRIALVKHSAFTAAFIVASVVAFAALQP
jgi:hypothetical protein